MAEGEVGGGDDELPGAAEDEEEWDENAPDAADEEADAGGDGEGTVPGRKKGKRDKAGRRRRGDKKEAKKVAAGPAKKRAPRWSNKVRLCTSRMCCIIRLPRTCGNVKGMCVSTAASKYCSASRNVSEFLLNLQGR